MIENDGSIMDSLQNNFNVKNLGWLMIRYLLPPSMPQAAIAEVIKIPVYGMLCKVKLSS